MKLRVFAKKGENCCNNLTTVFMLYTLYDVNYRLVERKVEIMNTYDGIIEVSNIDDNEKNCLMSDFKNFVFPNRTMTLTDNIVKVSGRMDGKDFGEKLEFFYRNWGDMLNSLFVREFVLGNKDSQVQYFIEDSALVFRNVFT